MDRIRNILEVNGVQYVTYDNGAAVTPPIVPPVEVPPVVTPPTTLPAGAKLIPWASAGQQTPVVGPVAVHIPVPGEAVGRVRVFLELSTGASELPTGSLYSGVDRRTADGGGVVQWNVRMGGPAGPGESQGTPGADLVVNVEAPAGQTLFLQFQWDPGYPPTAG